jgi:phosphoribosylformylglycinamidine synthase
MNRRGLINAAHDLAEGGLAVALAECCLASVESHGATIRTPKVQCLATWLFSEAPTRAIITCEAARSAELTHAAELAGLSLVPLGQVGGDRLIIEDLIDLPVSRLRKAYETLPF